MGGLAVLFFIVLYLVIAFKVVGKFKGSRYQSLVLGLAVLIPSGDAMVGRLYLKYLCAKEGGLKVYRVAEHVEGFMSNGTHSDYWVQERGYQYGEDRLANGLTTRYSKQGDKVIREDNVSPKSKYKLNLLNLGDARHIFMRQQFAVEAVNSTEILATDTQVYFNGGWAERFLAAFSDAGGGSVSRCDNSRLDYEMLVATVLKH